MQSNLSFTYINLILNMNLYNTIQFSSFSNSEFMAELHTTGFDLQYHSGSGKTHLIIKLLWYSAYPNCVTW